MRLFSYVAVTLLLSSSLISRADTLAGINAGTGTDPDVDYYGQAFTPTESANNIAFNFYSATDAPSAPGTGFLFTQAFSGTPAQLSSSGTGFVGSAIGSGGFYTFTSSLTLTSGTQYFFYENASVPGLLSGGGPYAGGDVFFSDTGDAFYDQSLNDTNLSSDFLVTGTAIRTGAPAPEPSSLLLLGTGVIGVAGALRRRLV